MSELRVVMIEASSREEVTCFDNREMAFGKLLSGVFA